MDERFLEAVVHKRAPLLARLSPVATRLWRLPVSGHVVLGRRLRPFSLWHQQLLQGINSPFLTVWKETPNSIQLFQNLYIATEICKLSPFQTPNAESFIARLRRKYVTWRFYLIPGIGRFGSKSGYHRRLCVLLLEAAKLGAYIADYASAPIAFPTKHSRSVQTPVNLYQIELYRRFHPEISVKSAWAMSFGEIAWENTGALEASGAQIEIMTEARIQAREAAIKGGKEQSAKRKASNAPNGNEKKRI